MGKYALASGSASMHEMAGFNGKIIYERENHLF